MIDSTAGCELLSFFDAYSGYHQIKLNPADRLKTTFITPFRAFFYLTMTFGMRNAGATFFSVACRSVSSSNSAETPTFTWTMG